MLVRTFNSFAAIRRAVVDMPDVPFSPRRPTPAPTPKPMAPPITVGFKPPGGKGPIIIDAAPSRPSSGGNTDIMGPPIIDVARLPPPSAVPVPTPTTTPAPPPVTAPAPTPSTVPISTATSSGFQTSITPDTYADSGPSVNDNGDAVKPEETIPIEDVSVISTPEKLAWLGGGLLLLGGIFYFGR